MSNTILTFWFLFQVCWHQLHMMSPFSQAVFTDYLQKDRLAFIKRIFYEKVWQRGGHFFSFPMKASLSWLYFVWINVSFTALQYISIVPSQFDCSVTAGCPWRLLCPTHCAPEYGAPHTVPCCSSHTVPKIVSSSTALCSREIGLASYKLVSVVSMVFPVSAFHLPRAEEMAAHNGAGGRRIALCCVPHRCRPPCVFSSHQPPPAAELAAHNRGELDGVASVARREHHDSCSPLLVISAHTTIDLPHMCCCALSHPCSDLHPISIHS